MGPQWSDRWDGMMGIYHVCPASYIIREMLAKSWSILFVGSMGVVLGEVKVKKWWWHGIQDE